MVEEKKDLKVKKLEVKNIMGAEEVNIQPKNELVIIAGGNAQGKTSIIRSIEMALKGRQAMEGISKVVRDGEKEGDIIADLGDMIIKRHYTDDGKERVKVIKKDGTEYSSPEGLLRGMINKMLRPVDFMKMKPKEQKQLLINSLDLDIDIDGMYRSRQELYDQRTVKGRERDNAKAILSELQPPESWEEMPKEEISVTKLVQELEKRKDHNSEITRVDNGIMDLKDDIKSIDTRIEDLQNQIKRLETEKKNLQEDLKEKEDWYAKAEMMDEDKIRREIDKVEEQNIKIREAIKYREKYNTVVKMNAEYGEFTQKIDEIDKVIEKSLSRANMPIPGLEIYDDGLGLKGIPLKQVAESDQLKAAIGISMGLEPKPEIKVLIIENGRDLTDENWDIVKEMAKKNGYQIWVQYVDDSGEVGFVIKEGKVAKVND